MHAYLLVGLGGFLGANARYLVAGWVAAKWGVTFPYGTLMINLSGSFLLSLLAMMIAERMVAYTATRLLIMVGFLGSFTTFSTFSFELLQLFNAGRIVSCMVYMSSSIVGCGLAGGAGVVVGRLL